MNKKELIEFRWKLVRAKEMCSRRNWTRFVDCLSFCGLERDVDYRFFMPAKLKNRYNNKAVLWSALTPAEERIAMWDNSIAHVDKLIAEAK